MSLSLGAQVWKIGLLALAVVASPTATAATIKAFDNTIYIEGIIERGDFDRFRQVLRQTVGPISVSLNSPGGDLGEALKIARLVRDAWIVTEVSDGLFVRQKWQTFPKPVRCDSACSLIYIAGVARIYGVSDQENGRPALGFHRAYLSPDANAKLDASSSESEFAQAKKAYVAALTEFGTPQGFVEEIVRTRSDELLMVGAADFYHIFGESRQLGDGIPWLEEFFIARCGPRLTDAEYKWMDSHRDEAEGKILHDKIYQRLDCVNQLNRDHQSEIRKRLGDTP